MKELAQVVPDAKVLLALEPEELGAKLLFLIRKRPYSSVLLSNLENELWEGSHLHNQEPLYPAMHRGQISLALREAWAWLEAQGLLIPEDGNNGRNGWRVLSRRARRFESQAEFANEHRAFHFL